MGKVDVVVIAALGGFLAGILLAPKSGKETREDLMNKKNEYQEKAEDSFETIKRGASSIKEELASGGDAVRGIAEDVRGNVKDTVDSTSQSVKRNAQR